MVVAVVVAMACVVMASVVTACIAIAYEDIASIRFETTSLKLHS